MRFRDIRAAEKTKREQHEFGDGPDCLKCSAYGPNLPADHKCPGPPPKEVQIPMVRKQRRALIASERRKLCLGRDGGQGNWIPRPRAVRVAARRKKAKAEVERRKKSKFDFFMKAIEEGRVKIPTQSRERNDNAREEADSLGHPIHQGQLAEEL